MRPVIYLVTGIILFLLLGAVAIAASTKEPYADLDVMVEAIRQIENWDGRARGAAGERGPWQITPAVWAEVSDKPFSWAECRTLAEQTEARRAAREKIYRISQRLKAAKTSSSAFMIALVWGAGWDSVYYHQPHAPSKAKRSYADRAANLYYDLAKKAEPPPSLFKIESSDPSAPAPLPRQRP